MKEQREERKTGLFAVEVENLASAAECTGLIPAAVQTPEEGEAYAQLYAIHTQKPAWQAETDGKPIPRKERQQKRSTV